MKIIILLMITITTIIKSVMIIMMMMMVMILLMIVVIIIIVIRITTITKLVVIIIVVIVVVVVMVTIFLVLLPIVLKPGLTWRVDLGRGQPGAGTEPGWRKNRGRKNSVWLGKTRSKPGCNPLTFFFTKTTSFWFKKKELTRATRWPGDPVKTRNPGLGPGRVWKLCYYH